MNDLELIENELPDKRAALVGGRCTGKSVVNVGTIGHIYHGKKNITTLCALALSAPPELPEYLVKTEAVEKPYYRRFEKKRR
jgi:hypothetical protein